MNEEFLKGFKRLQVLHGHLFALLQGWTARFLANYPFDELQKDFYKIEFWKKEIDKLILSLRPYQVIGEGQQREEKEVKTLINSIYFTSQSIMSNAQDLFSCFLVKNQIAKNEPKTIQG